MLESLSAHLTTVLAGPARGRLVRCRGYVAAVRHIEPALAGESNDDLRRRSLALRYRAKSREPLDKLLPEAFALVSEAAHRTLGMRPYDVQLLGGAAIHFRSVAEMQTGEGKTLTATLPLYLNALGGRGAHLATANDYLARRDCEWMTPVYRLLGLTAGVVEAAVERPQRRQAYACDITYGTAKEFGFDFLRDRLLLRSAGAGAVPLFSGGETRGEQLVQREPHFIMVDEADGLLIDEARTPLIISALPGDAQRAVAASFRWAAEIVAAFEEDEHYDYDERTQGYELTFAGRQLARALPKPPEMNSVPLLEIYEYVERALRAEKRFLKDQQYVLRDGEVVIVDEFTGRLAEGRKWRDGLHQAVEAKEQVKVTVDSGQAARVTVQDFFRRYEMLCGMTGTAISSAREIRVVFGARVVVVPTNRPCIRQPLPEQVYGNETAKWEAILAEIQAMRETGRPVLVGTRSIDKSEHLSRLLTDAKVPHQVLNARRLKAEAEIVALAGQPGRVTVSTNMAGRGTDIKLGEGVAELGGLHVLCTEMHDSARIDRQLIGRCARQGDPGSYRVFMALDDEILRTALPVARYRRLREQGRTVEGPLNHLVGLFRRAQRKIERRHYRDRKILLYHEQERTKLQRQMGLDPYLDTVG